MLKSFEKAVGIAISIALVLVVSLQMTDRFLFSGNLQLAWTEEIARILLVWLTFWGAVLVQEENSHLRVDFLTDRLPLKWQNYASMLIDSAVLLFLLVVIISGADYALHEMIVALPATGLPRSVSILAVVIGSLLIARHVAHGLFVRVRQLQAAHERVN